jgi:hypothetical protein
MNTAPNSTTWIWSLVSSSTFQSVLGILILLTVCGIAISLLSKLRDSNTQDAPLDEMLRKNFEEMRSEGVINEAEFRNIASLLAESPGKSSVMKPKTSEQTDSPNSDEK